MPDLDQILTTPSSPAVASAVPSLLHLKSARSEREKRREEQEKGIPDRDDGALVRLVLYLLLDSSVAWCISWRQACTSWGITMKAGRLSSIECPDERKAGRFLT
eukprot:2546689-Rhodomonas_salina.1